MVVEVVVQDFQIRTIVLEDLVAVVAVHVMRVEMLEMDHRTLEAVEVVFEILFLVKDTIQELAVQVL